jgi:hypothetical protein
VALAYAPDQYLIVLECCGGMLYNNNVTGFEKRGLLSRIKNFRFCYHFEADNERSTIEFESSQYLIWLWID